MNFIATLFRVVDAPEATIGADDLRWFLLQNKVKENTVKRVFDLFRSNGIEPVLIKGWAAALNYPDDVPRDYIDTDIAVAASDYDQARQVCDSKAAEGLAIDLHRGLRHLDSLQWNDLFANAHLVKIDDSDIRILRPEDHLRVLCIHWLNDGGANKIRLWDIYYAVANRPSDFDWTRCLETVSEYRRRWIITAIAITHEYLGLKIDDLPFYEEATAVPGWIRKCLEREWNSTVHLEPVIMHLRSPSSLAQQIVKRIPPNPLRATIEMEGRIDARTRIFYQIGCFARLLANPLRSRARRKQFEENRK
ncbi:MAG: nucleotidyltransferase family protein [Acidobacteriota bacterium]